MKLLILTQKVDKNDPVLGFFHRWIEEFAAHCESLIVVCLEKGEYKLPANVRVLSLGKEAGKSRLKYLVNFYKYIYRERGNYDAVFVHMNPEYVVFGGVLWHYFKKRIILWYVHRQVSWRLYLADLLAYRILTAAKESLHFNSKKIIAVGHGIDTEIFACSGNLAASEALSILAVGRITKIKNLDILIQAARILAEHKPGGIKVSIIGSTVTDDDEVYFKYLKDLVRDLNLETVVYFLGAVPHRQLPSFYCRNDLVVNLCPEGGVDKTVLEAMSCGVPVLVSNKVFSIYLGEYANDYLCAYRDANVLAQKIEQHCSRRNRAELAVFLRQQVEKNHELKKLVPLIFSFY